MHFRTLALVGCLLLYASFARLTAATKLFLTVQSPGEITISVDPELHQEFGLTYPVTYKLSIPSGSSNLVVYTKHLEGAAWTPLPEKTPSDYFNGEEVVRFDYGTNAAYVSVGFDFTSDDIFLRVRDGANQPVDINFQEICRYYDNRQSVVTVTADDWNELTNLAFVKAVDMFRYYRLPMTTAIITGGCTANIWQSIQAELDSGLVEAASHTRTHTNPPYADPISEIIGSKTDLLTNLRMPSFFRKGSQGYVYTWIAPYGSTTTETEAVVGEARYLVDRMTFLSTGNFTAWDTTQRRYLKDGKTVEMGPLFGGLTDANLLNNAFHQSLAAGTIYHLLIHPELLADSGAWSKPYTNGHLAYISNRTNVWYVNFGTLYLYHLLQDDAPGSIQRVSGAPRIIAEPINITAHQMETATFTVEASGSAPLLYRWQWNGLDIAGATNAIYTTPPLTRADSNTFYRCIVSNDVGSDTSTTATLLVLPAIVNILTNPGFESGTSPWVFWSNGSAALSQVAGGTEGARSGQVSIMVQGTNVQLYQANLTLQPNTEYRLSFDAYSNTGHDMEVSLSEHVSPYTNYGLSARKFDLGNFWESYSVTFTTAGFSGTVTDGRLWFSFGPYNVAGDVYNIDNVVLARVSNLQPPEAIPPAITMQPAGQRVLAGQSAIFTITATGTGPLFYQWQKNGADIAGATGSSYSTPPAIASDSGALYRCRVLSASGSVTSSEARLTVITPRPPVITLQPRDSTVQEGNPVQFLVAAAGDTVLTYQWQKNGSAIAGANSARYNIQAAARVDSGAAFRCIVTNDAGKDTSRGAILHVRPIPPTQFLAGPASGSSSLRLDPFLYWHPTPGASSYHLQVSTDSTFATGVAINDSTITDTTFHVRGLAFITRYFWRVKANGTDGQFSHPWSFTTIIAPAGPTALVSPANGTADLAVSSTEFTWESAQRAIYYRLQIATDSTFASGIALDDSTLTDTARSVTILRTDRRYYWRVSARGPGGTGAFSTVWFFETIKSKPLAASLVSPANHATGVPVIGLPFRWNSVLSATHYAFQLSTDSTFGAGLFMYDSALVDTTKIVNGLTRGTRYYWRVCARNSAGWGTYSPAWILTTVIPPPGRVALIDPPQDAVDTADSSMFIWHSPMPEASQFWFEISTDSNFTSIVYIDSTITDTATVFHPMQNGRMYYWRVRGGDSGGWGPFSETRTIRVVTTTVAEYRGLPHVFELEQNHPNPFNPSTKIGFGLPVASQARIDVYNMLGQKLATILDQRMAPGYHTVTFDASVLPSGAYIYRLITDKGAFVRKMILMK